MLKNSEIKDIADRIANLELSEINCEILPISKSDSPKKGAQDYEYLFKLILIGD